MMKPWRFWQRLFGVLAAGFMCAIPSAPGAEVATNVQPPSQGQGRTRESFDFGWRFSPGDAAGAEQAAFNDATWRALDLPHDWSIEGPYDENAPTGGPGGYL